MIRKKPAPDVIRGSCLTLVKTHKNDDRFAPSIATAFPERLYEFDPH
jgi:hypothetical protein